MSAARDSGDPRYGRPVFYRIIVEGALGSQWSDRLAGMKITPRSAEDGTPRRTLEGEILDQAQLTGVLNRLQGLHPSIVGVKTLDREGSESNSTQSLGTEPMDRRAQKP